VLLSCHFFVVGFDNLICPCGTDAVLWKIKEEHIVIQIAACWKKVYIAVRHFHEKSGPCCPYIPFALTWCLDTSVQAHSIHGWSMEKIFCANYAVLLGYIPALKH